MDPADAGPPPKRRRTSSPRPAPRRSSLAEDRHPPHSPPAPRAARRNPLEGFNDEEELPDEEDRRSDGDRGLEDDDGGAADGEDDEEHCAVCLSPIENKVRALTGAGFAYYVAGSLSSPRRRSSRHVTTANSAGTASAHGLTRVARCVTRSDVLTQSHCLDTGRSCDSSNLRNLIVSRLAVPAVPWPYRAPHP